MQSAAKCVHQIAPSPKKPATSRRVSGTRARVTNGGDDDDDDVVVDSGVARQTRRINPIPIWHEAHATTESAANHNRRANWLAACRQPANHPAKRQKCIANYAHLCTRAGRSVRLCCRKSRARARTQKKSVLMCAPAEQHTTAVFVIHKNPDRCAYFGHQSGAN